MVLCLCVLWWVTARAQCTFWIYIKDYVYSTCLSISPKATDVPRTNTKKTLEESVIGFFSSLEYLAPFNTKVYFFKELFIFNLSRCLRNVVIIQQSKCKYSNSAYLHMSKVIMNSQQHVIIKFWWLLSTCLKWQWLHNNLVYNIFGSWRIIKKLLVLLLLYLLLVLLYRCCYCIGVLVLFLLLVFWWYSCHVFYLVYAPFMYLYFMFHAKYNILHEG